MGYQQVENGKKTLYNLYWNLNDPLYTITRGLYLFHLNYIYKCTSELNYKFSGNKKFSDSARNGFRKIITQPILRKGAGKQSNKKILPPFFCFFFVFI